MRPPMRTHNRYYDEHREEVARVRDCLRGQKAVKQQGQIYLPRPTGLTSQQYDAYRERALYLGVAERAPPG